MTTTLVQECECGHLHSQHELRSGGMFGCYIAGCLCVDFSGLIDALNARCEEWDARHGEARPDMRWNYQWQRTHLGRMVIADAWMSQRDSSD